jgi:hypothetical protein
MAVSGIDTQLVTVTVDHIVAGVPAGAPSEVSCILEIGTYKQTRATKKYSCMSSNDSTVGLGSITRDPLTFGLLYNEDASDGQQKIKTAFDNNTPLAVVIEFDNTPSGGAHGTQITATMGVQEYSLDMPKDAKIEASFTLEFTGTATVVEAA